MGDFWQQIKKKKSLLDRYYLPQYKLLDIVLFFLSGFASLLQVAAWYSIYTALWNRMICIKKALNVHYFSMTDNIRLFKLQNKMEVTTTTKSDGSVFYLKCNKWDKYTFFLHGRYPQCLANLLRVHIW